MEKQDYIQKKESILNAKKALDLELKNLNEDYIESNSDFKIGDRVKVVTPEHTIQSFATSTLVKVGKTERFAYVDGYDVDYLNDVVEVLLKEKKDGTVSKQRDYWNSHSSYLEKA